MKEADRKCEIVCICVNVYFCYYVLGDCLAYKYIWHWLCVSKLASPITWQYVYVWQFSWTSFSNNVIANFLINYFFYNFCAWLWLKTTTFIQSDNSCRMDYFCVNAEYLLHSFEVGCPGSDSIMPHKEASRWHSKEWAVLIILNKMTLNILHQR